MSSQPVHLKGRDLEILYRHLAGQSNKEIAADLGISDATVSSKVNSDWFRTDLAIIHARTLSNITNGTYSPLTFARAHSVEAMNKNIELMRSAKDERVQQKSAFDILDRAGFSAPKRTESLNLNDIFDKMTAEELELYAESGTIPQRFQFNPTNLLPSASPPGQP